MHVTPYLNFNGTCRQAFTRYQEIFGGELQILGVGDVPAEDGAAVPPDKADMVIHAALVLGDGLLLASDTWEEGPTAQGMYVNFSTADVAEAERVWAALADGGKVEMDLGPTFWSPAFGVCVDRFGTPWMVNAEAPASA